MTQRFCLITGYAASLLLVCGGARAQTTGIPDNGNLSVQGLPVPATTTASTAAPAPQAAPVAPGPTQAEPPAAPQPGTPQVAPTSAPTSGQTESPPQAPSTPASAPAIAPARLTVPRLGWDLNLEGSLGRYLPGHQGFGFGRARGGVLYSADPVFLALGMTYEWSNLATATFGVQAEALHIESGVWVQTGALLDTQVHPGAMFALGWSVLGAEVQYRKFDPSDWGYAVVGKIRIPVTFIAKAFE